MAGRRRRLPSQKALHDMTLKTLGQLRGGPIMSALNFCYFSFKRKVSKKQEKHYLCEQIKNRVHRRQQLLGRKRR